MTDTQKDVALRLLTETHEANLVRDTFGMSGCTMGDLRAALVVPAVRQETPENEGRGVKQELCMCDECGEILDAREVCHSGDGAYHLSGDDPVYACGPIVPASAQSIAEELIRARRALSMQAMEGRGTDPRATCECGEVFAAHDGRPFTCGNFKASEGRGTEEERISDFLRNAALKRTPENAALTEILDLYVRGNYTAYMVADWIRRQSASSVTGHHRLAAGIPHSTGH